MRVRMSVASDSVLTFYAEALAMFRSVERKEPHTNFLAGCHVEENQNKRESQY